jgi:peptidase inhibitor family I36
LPQRGDAPIFRGMIRTRIGAAIAAVAACMTIAPAASAQSVTFFEHIDYVGASFAASGDMSFVGWDWNDRISSVSVPAGMTVTLYEDADFGGATLTLTSDASDLRWFSGPGPDGTWNDQVSSIRISGGGGPPPPPPPPPPPTFTTTTVLVNGSFNANPPWMDTGSPEFNAIAGTYGAAPVQFRWTENNGVFYPLYDGIVAGGFDLANFISVLPPGDVNVVTHSHGGNVAIWATYLMNRPIRHLINLGTPINFDLWRYLGGAGAYRHCQISSDSDWTQFFGSSPGQVYAFFDSDYYAGLYAYYAVQALINGDYDSFYYDSAVSAWYAYQAYLWFWSTKIELGAPTLVFGGLEHSDLHEPPVWYAIAGACAVS